MLGHLLLPSCVHALAAAAWARSSVSRSLEHLAAWRERRRQSGQAQGGLLSPLAAWMTGTSGKHADAVMFRVRCCWRCSTRLCARALLPLSLILSLSLILPPFLSLSSSLPAGCAQVIAASALVITEARQLLEMAEPAWHYAAYHELWRVAADDFELEPRFKALERKVRACGAAATRC